ncbi:MAG: transcription-repair coupling factor, partial [Lachnospiraceae bacterium]|nr:transcription-repair coupling factor [Lachnospiraceae bacterium]
LYCKMLEEAVRRKKGQEAQEEETFDTVLDIRSDAYIPSSYIPNESLKLEVYKKISLIGSEEDRENLCEELEDRYGDVPEAVSNLMMAALIREKAHALYMTSVKGNAADLTFRFHPAAKVRSGNIPALITEMGGAMRFLGGPEPGLNWRERDPRKIGKADVTETLNLLLDRIKELLI